MDKLKTLFPHFISSLLNSYTQIFFSNNKKFALVLMLVSFFDLNCGTSGLLGLVTANLAAYLIGFNRLNIRAGMYGFNALLVGLGLGLFFQPNPAFFLVVAFSSLLTLFITVTLEGIFYKYGLPFLSLPFLAGIWMVTLATRQFESLHISERGIFSMNEMYEMGGLKMVDLYNWFNNTDLPISLVIYFRSLGAILFQYHMFPGVLIALGLLYNSRISFMLSLLGFYSAYFYYQLIGANFNELNYGYIGFNFILTAIAIGGFFVISSRYSLLWVLLLTPVISFIISSTSVFLWTYQLSIFSLPFNFTVLLFLYILKFRERSLLKPEMVYVQQYSPEKNLYSQLNYQSRFSQANYFGLSLPFYGEWVVTQGHNGEHTHREGWKHAWDFEIQDEEQKLHKGEGKAKEDYYCFNKPVLAPADGWVVEVVDYIEDNDVGGMNIGQNWGNTIIIKHLEGLFTKISHLKQDSFKVKKGDFIRKGDIIAACGNSGRSPRPHIHFQVQATPFIGSKTLDYPVSHFMLHTEKGHDFKSYSRPTENQVISNVSRNNTLSKAFTFIPGQKVAFEAESPESLKGKVFTWEVMSDYYNNTFLYDEETDSKAYFKNDGSLFTFTGFDGDKKSLLFAFYIGAYKVLTGFYKGLEIKDTYPPSDLNNKLLIYLQDFLAPFFLFMHSHYSMTYDFIEDDLGSSTLTLSSRASVSIGKKSTTKMSFNFVISQDKISSFTIQQSKQVIKVKEINTNA